VQIEHALAAVQAGATSLGIKGRLLYAMYPELYIDLDCRPERIAKNGVVIATEKKNPSLLIDDSSLEKVAIICPNIGFVYSGMGPDFRVLVTKARKIAQAYWKVYGEYPPVKVLVSDVAAIVQKSTQQGWVILSPWSETP
jgi:20S proteasome subunit alpha 2